MHKFRSYLKGSIFIFNTKTNLLTFDKTITVQCKAHTKYKNTLCGRNSEFYYVKADGTPRSQWVSKGYMYIETRGELLQTQSLNLHFQRSLEFLHDSIKISL